jgi:hypothetical protein
MTMHLHRPSPSRWMLAGAVAATAFLAATCGGPPPAPSVTPAPVETASSASTGPTTWSAWVDHLGFGGQTGPNEIRRIARYISDHSGSETLFDLDADISLVTSLISWMDAHPATACWAQYHSTVRAELVEVRDGWVAARPTVEKGGLVPMSIVKSAFDVASAANDLPAPSNCP